MATIKKARQNQRISQVTVFLFITVGPLFTPRIANLSPLLYVGVFQVKLESQFFSLDLLIEDFHSLFEGEVFVHTRYLMNLLNPVKRYLLLSVIT